MPRPHIAVFSFLMGLAVSLLPSPVRASGGYGDPPRTCSDAVFFALDEEVTVQCARRLTCLDMSGCFNLRRTRQLLADCRAAINALDIACYGGTYIFLKVELLALQAEIEHCSARIAMRPPIGCGKPCPL